MPRKATQNDATPEGRRQTEREFKRALQKGTLVRSKGAAIPRTDPALLEELMEQAKEKDRLKSHRP
jgi:hypothetical protein